MCKLGSPYLTTHSFQFLNFAHYATVRNGFFICLDPMCKVCTEQFLNIGKDENEYNCYYVIYSFLLNRFSSLIDLKVTKNLDYWKLKVRL